MHFSKITAFIVLAVVTTTAMAGAKFSGDIVIDDHAEYAAGSLRAAHDSSDNMQLIFCELQGISGGIFCRARNINGENALCNTTNPDFAKVVQMINASSYVTFSWDGYGNCTNIVVRNGSNFLN